MPAEGKPSKGGTERIEEMAIRKLRRIFLGSVLLIILVVLNQIFLRSIGVPVAVLVRTLCIPLLFWALVVTCYAFHALWSVAAKEKRKLQDMALRDVASGAYTAAYLHNKLRDEDYRAMRVGRGNAIGYIRLRGIEEVNGEYGYAVGDVLLKAAVGLITNGLPWDGFVARLGGVEFVAFLPDMTVEAAQTALDKMRQRIKELRLDLGHRGTLGGLDADVSVSTYPCEGMSMEEVILAARNTACGGSG